MARRWNYFTEKFKIVVYKVVVRDGTTEVNNELRAPVENSFGEILHIYHSSSWRRYAVRRCKNT